MWSRLSRSNKKDKFPPFVVVVAVAAAIVRRNISVLLVGRVQNRPSNIILSTVVVAVVVVLVVVIAILRIIGRRGPACRHAVFSARSQCK